MVRSDDRPDDQEVAELWDLGYVRRMDWDKELARCSLLLKRVPTLIPASAGPTALRVAMREVVKRAYVAVVSNPDERVPASETMAAAAVMGLVTEDPETYKKRPPGEKRLDRASKRYDRLDVASKWFYEEVQADAFRRTHEGKCLITFRNSLSRVLNDNEVIAQITAQVESEELLKPDASGPQPSRPVQTVDQTLLDPGLIERRSYIDQIACLASAHRITCIWGEAGTGKTTLARLAATALAQGRPVAILHAAEDGILWDGIVDLLVGEGLQPHSWTESGCRAELRRVLGANPNVRAVIVDDLQDEALLARLVPDSPQIPILVTMRSKPSDDRMDAAVEIQEFTDAEARRFVEHRLEDVDELERLTLIDLLGRRPLALELATRYVIQTPDVHLSDLLTALVERVTTTLDHISTPTPQFVHLVRLYEVILAKIMADDTVRPSLDNFLALAGKSGVFEKRILQLYVEWGQTSASSRIEHSSGVRTLMNYALLRDSDVYWWAMHPLTWSILREMRESALVLIEDNYFIRFLAVDEALADSTVRVPGSLRILRKALRFSANVFDGWRYLCCLDQFTWVAVREYVDASGAKIAATVRYYLLPTGVYKHNYETGKKERLDDIEEARRLYSGALLYNLAVQVIEAPLEWFGGQASSVSAGQAFMESDDMQLLRALEDSPRARYAFLADLCHSFAEQCSLASYSILGRVTQIGYDELIAGEKMFPLPELQAYVNWLIEDGDSSTALLILDQFQSSREFLGAREVVEVAAMRARASIMLGDWATAECQLDDCIDLLSGGAFETAVSLHGIGRAYSMKVDLLLMRGSDEATIRAAFSALEAHWNSQPEVAQGSSTETRFHRASGRVNGAIAMYTMEEGLREGKNVFPRQALTAACDELLRARENGRGTIRSRLEREEIRYDLALAQCLLAGQFDLKASLQESEEKVGHSFSLPVPGSGPDVPSYRDHQTSYRLFLLACKLALLCGAVDQIDNCAGFRLIEARARVMGEYESAYWYAEYLAVLAIYAVRLGYPSLGLRVAAKESYEYIGRTDRWEKLEQTLETSRANLTALENWAVHFWLLTW